MPIQQSHRLAMLETAAEQDAITRQIAKAEEAELEAKGSGGVELDFDTTDSSDDDFLPPYEPRCHDDEASSSITQILQRMERSDRQRDIERQESAAALAE